MGEEKEEEEEEDWVREQPSITMQEYVAKKTYKYIQEAWDKRKIDTSELDAKLVDFEDPGQEL